MLAVEIGLLLATIAHRPGAVLAWITAIGGIAVLARCTRRGAAPRSTDGTSEYANAVEPEIADARGPTAGTRERCIAHLAAALRGTATDAMPLAMHLGDALCEVFFDRQPPRGWGPWTRTPSGWVWVAPHEALAVPFESEGDVEAMPALARLGRTPRGELWLHLEAFPSVAVIGPDAATRHAVGELVRTLHPARVHVLCVGDAALNDTDAQRQADARIQEVDELLRARGWPTLLLTRVNDADPGAFAPTLVLCDDPSFGTDLPSHPGLTILMRAEVLVGAALELELSGSEVRVPFLNGLAVAVDGLPTSAAVEEPDERDEQPEAALSGEAEVQLLGPVRVVRDERAINATAKSVELIAYLACHPEGVADDRVQAALWPEQAPRLKTWRNRVWAARQALGTGAQGEPLLCHFEDRIGRLSPVVTTDIARLADVLDHLDGDPGDGLEALREALTRVRGRPFEEATGYEWAFAELHVAHAERLVTDASLRAVELALAAGNVPVALWATEQGLRCCPASEPLAQARMRAFHAAGDLAGVEAAMRDLLASLDADDPAEVLHADTLSLYEELVPRRSSPRERRRPRAAE